MNPTTDTPKAAHTPKRYDPSWRFREMQSNPQGDYVDYQDYATLLQQRDDLLATLEVAPDFGGTPKTAFGHEYREWQFAARAAIARVKEGR